MNTRPLNERLNVELDFIRTQLTDVSGGLTPDDMDWAPREGMKSYRKQFVEIAVTEQISLGLLRDGFVADWDRTWAFIEGRAAGKSLLSELEHIRLEMLAYLSTASDDDLRARIQIPGEWSFVFGGTDQVEREELVREIARHEYYHTAQIVSYRWIQGHNPYEGQ